MCQKRKRQKELAGSKVIIHEFQSQSLDYVQFPPFQVRFTMSKVLNIW